MQIRRSKTAIARDIVKQVEAAGRPISLATIEANVPGFAEWEGELAWSYEIDDEFGNSDIIWDGMTKEGCDGLRSALRQGRVAMQQGSRLNYWLEGRFPTSPRWFPITLAPACAATFQMEGRLFSAEEKVNDAMAQRAKRERKPGKWRRLWRV